MAGFEECAFLIHSADDEEIIRFAQQHTLDVLDLDAPSQHLEKVMKDV